MTVGVQNRMIATQSDLPLVGVKVTRPGTVPKLEPIKVTTVPGGPDVGLIESNTGPAACEEPCEDVEDVFEEAEELFEEFED